MFGRLVDLLDVFVFPLFVVVVVLGRSDVFDYGVVARMFVRRVVHFADCPVGLFQLVDALDAVAVAVFQMAFQVSRVMVFDVVPELVRLGRVLRTEIMLTGQKLLNGIKERI